MDPVGNLSPKSGFMVMDDSVSFIFRVDFVLPDSVPNNVSESRKTEGITFRRSLNQ